MQIFMAEAGIAQSVWLFC